jgi:hypothetical protein
MVFLVDNNVKREEKKQMVGVQLVTDTFVTQLALTKAIASYDQMRIGDAKKYIYWITITNIA